MSDCDPKLRALKSLFLGPQSENRDWLELEWVKVLRHWMGWRQGLFPGDGTAITQEDQNSPLFQKRQQELQRLFSVLLKTLERESPKFTPRYLGHMISEVSLPGILGHVAALLHNPNQTSREVSQTTSILETEAIGDLLAMVGLPPNGRGHFTSGGTVANLEFVWRALFRLDKTLSLALCLCERGLFPRDRFVRLPSLSWDWFEEKMASHEIQEKELVAFSLLQLGQASFAEKYLQISGHRYRAPLLLAPASRHYSWPKALVLTGLGRESLWDLPLNEKGRLSIEGLNEGFSRAEREGRTVCMVVSVAGATGTGAVDPVHLVQDFLDKQRAAKGDEVWHHVDAAFGGYFCSLLRGTLSRTETLLAPETKTALSALSRVSSVTLDPHKLGFVPYSCGTFLARDSFHYRSPSFAAPYLLNDNAGAWIHTIEGSRAATGVTATWLANRSIGLNMEGYGLLLGLGITATRELGERISNASSEFVLFSSDLNIINFALCCGSEPLSRMNERTLACFERFRSSPNFAISKTELSCDMYHALLAKELGARKVAIDASTVCCLRLVLMNPFLTTQETKTSYISAFMEELFSYARSIS